MARKAKVEEITAESITFSDLAPLGLWALVYAMPDTAHRVSWLKVFMSHAWEVAQRNEDGEKLAQVVETVK